MTSNDLHSASELGISCSPQKTESNRIEFNIGTTEELNQYPKYPISIEESERFSNSESSQSGHRGRAKNSDSMHTASSPTIGNFEKSWKDPEIDIVLGDAKSRLKSGAKLLPLDPGQQKIVSLEKSKRRGRVDVNIFLRNDVCVENGCLQGLVRLHIRKPPKKSQSILLSGGKVRIVGFESTTKEEGRSTFYQFCANISNASGLDAVYSSTPDADGFREAEQGIHLLPFSLQLASSQARGRPKGSMYAQSGISVRYIAMVSFRIKDTKSGKLSIAHFYRDCSIWPRLNPATVLSPTSRPIQVTVSSSITMGGSGKVNLTASIHRLHWIAGQLCHVKFDVVNHSNKTLKLVTLELFQTVTTFRVKNSPLDEDESQENLPKSTTFQKLVAQSSLTMGERGSRGHASAKGWWMGVAPGASQTFLHSILLPTYALSISRGKLLEVSYNLRATIGPGSFLSSNIDVTVPLEIINILSIDPPHHIAADLVPGCAVAGQCGNKDSSSYDPLMRDDDTDSTESEADQAFEYDSDSLGNLSLHDDTDDLVNHVVSSSNLEGENASRFADLYYSQPAEKPNKDSQDHSSKPVGTITSNSSKLPNVNSTTEHEELKKPPNFPARVVEKMEKRKNTSDEAGNTVQKPNQKEGSDCGLTIAEQIFGSPRRDVSRRDYLNSGYTASGSATKLSNHHEITGATSTEKSMLNGPLTDSPSTIGSRKVSINDIINAYTEIVHDKNDRSTASPQQGVQLKPDPGSHTTMSTDQNNPHPVTHCREQVSTDVVASRPRSKSVKDKIRDLEELAASHKANS